MTDSPSRSGTRYQTAARSNTGTIGSPGGTLFKMFSLFPGRARRDEIRAFVLTESAASSLEASKARMRTMDFLVETR